jgi:hypothetical protein
MATHAYTYLYNQCIDKTGYDELIAHIQPDILNWIDIQLKSPFKAKAIYLPNITEYELLDFLDGNGFIVQLEKVNRLTWYVLRPIDNT